MVRPRSAEWLGFKPDTDARKFGTAKGTAHDIDDLFPAVHIRKVTDDDVTVLVNESGGVMPSVRFMPRSSLEHLLSARRLLGRCPERAHAC